MSDHALFAPSASERWAACPGYIRLTQRVAGLYGEEKPSEAAEEGTLAHAVAAKLLTARNPTRAIRDAELPPDQRIALEIYVDTVEDYLDRLDAAGLHSKLYVEQALKLSADLHGTADCVIVHDGGVVVIDYKHGKRVFVEPDSLQLRIYGYMAVRKLAPQLEIADVAHGQDAKITLCIVQPRYIGGGDKVREVEYPLVEFMRDTAKTIVDAIDKAKAKVSKDEYNAGEHCIFCYAKPFCPAKIQLIKDALEKGENMEDVEALKFILDNKSELKSLCAKAKVLAISGLERGVFTPEQLGRGLKKQVGDRAWAHPEEKLAPLLRRHGVDKDAVWARKLISPAQAEKRIDDKKWLEKYVRREEKGVTLAPLGKDDPALLGTIKDQLAEYPAEEKEESKEQKEQKEQKEITFESEEF